MSAVLLLLGLDSTKLAGIQPPSCNVFCNLSLHLYIYLCFIPMLPSDMNSYLVGMRMRSTQYLQGTEDRNPLLQKLYRRCWLVWAGWPRSQNCVQKVQIKIKGSLKRFHLIAVFLNNLLFNVASMHNNWPKMLYRADYYQYKREPL